jgi:hypothetical protein
MKYTERFLMMAMLIASAMTCAASAQGLDVPFAVTADEHGYVYMAGTRTGADGRMDIVIVAYDTDGNVWREFPLPASAGGYTGVAGVDLIDSLLVVAGTMAEPGGGLDITAAGFHRPNILSADRPGVPVSASLLGQGYPNPAARGVPVRIAYAVATAGHLQLRVIDFLGRTIAVLAEGHHPPGSYSTELPTNRLPAGIYMYVLTAATTSEIRRFTVLR